MPSVRQSSGKAVFEQLRTHLLRRVSEKVGRQKRRLPEMRTNPNPSRERRGQRIRDTSGETRKAERHSLHACVPRLHDNAAAAGSKIATRSGSASSYRLVPCENRGCEDQCPLNVLELHMETCDHRIVECKVCKTRLPRKDMPAHQAVKRYFESSELKEHRLKMLHRRHQTEQAERRIEQEHYFPPQRRRAMSAGPVLLRAQSVEEVLWW